MSPERGRRRRAVAVVLAVLVLVVAVVGAVALMISRDNSPSGSHKPSASSSNASESASESVPETPSESPSESPLPAGTGQHFVVAPDGDDDAAGTRSAPWETLEKALTSLHAGDTLTVRDGEYDEELTDMKVEPGTSSEPITVVAAPGSHPVLRGLLWMHDANYWQFRGLNVTWSSDSSKSEHMVKFDGGERWAFTDAEVSNSGSYAGVLVTGEAKDWRLSGLFVHGTKDTHGANQDHLIYVSSTDGGGVIEHCLLTDSPNGRAVKVGPPDATDEPIRGVTIRYNTMYENLGPSNVQLSRSASDNRIYRNIMARPGTGEPNVGAYELTGDDNLVYDNLVWESTGVVPSDENGVADAGGNLDRDPVFADPSENDFHPLDSVAMAFGRYARGQ